MMPHPREARLVPRPRRAFSLIELLLVMAIMATLSLIALPRYATARDAYYVDAAVNRLVTDLAVARAIARSEDRRVVVKFDPGNDVYWFDNEPDPDRPGQDYTVYLNRSPYAVDLVSASFDGRKNMAFDRYGGLVKHENGSPFDEPGEVTLLSGVASRTIVVDVATGRAYLP